MAKGESVRNHPNLQYLYSVEMLRRINGCPPPYRKMHLESVVWIIADREYKNIVMQRHHSISDVLEDLKKMDYKSVIEPWILYGYPGHFGFGPTADVFNFLIDQIFDPVYRSLASAAICDPLCTTEEDLSTSTDEDEE